jgi:hypothetical protein
MRGASEIGVSNVMYCMYCGDVMILMDEGWYCPEGDMYYSSNLGKTVLSLLQAETNNADFESLLAQSRTSSLRCPRCQYQLISDLKGLHRGCLQCGLFVPASIIYQLIEFHPHHAPEK